MIADVGSYPMKKRMWTTVGFLVAPIIPAVTMAIWSSLVEQRAVGPTLQLTLFFYFYSALATIVFGIPTYFLLLRFKLVNLWSALTVGFVIGVIVSFIIKAPNFITLREILPMGAMGAAAAFTFWLVWKKTRVST